MKRLNKPERAELAQSLLNSLTQKIIEDDKLREEIAKDAGIGPYPEDHEMIAILIDEMLTILEQMYEGYCSNLDMRKSFVGDPIPFEIVD